jgi:hypothetical protein
MILEEDCKYSRKPHTHEYVKELLKSETLSLFYNSFQGDG